MNGYLYAVVDDNDRNIKLYASHTWAKRKASRRSNWRIETYVHADNRRLIEIAEFMTRGD